MSTDTYSTESQLIRYQLLWHPYPCVIADADLDLLHPPNPERQNSDSAPTWQAEERIAALEASSETRTAELEGQLQSATRYADGQGQHIAQLEAQLGELQRRQQGLQQVEETALMLPLGCRDW